MTLLEILAVALTIEVALLPFATIYIVAVYISSRRQASGRVPFLYSVIVALKIAITLGGGLIAVVLIAFFLHTPIRGGGELIGTALLPMLATPIAVAYAIWRVRRTEDDW